MIRVDPHELEGSAAVWRSCAVRLNEIGSTLAGCVVPPIPADLEAATVTLARAVDNALQRVADEFDRTASDLRRRAAVAATDLAAAASVAAPGSVGATANGSVVMLPVTSWELTSIFGADTTVMMTVSASTGLTTVPGASDTVPITVSTPGLTRVPGADGIVQLSLREPTVLPPIPAVPHDTLVAALNSSPGFAAIFSSQTAQRAVNIGFSLAPTRSDLEFRYGHRLTDAQFLSLVPERAPRHPGDWRRPLY